MPVPKSFSLIFIVEFLKFVSHQDKCREKWHGSEEENHMMKKEMAKYKV